MESNCKQTNRVVQYRLRKNGLSLADIGLLTPTEARWTWIVLKCQKGARRVQIVLIVKSLEW